LEIYNFKLKVEAWLRSRIYSGYGIPRLPITGADYTMKIILSKILSDVRDARKILSFAYSINRYPFSLAMSLPLSTL